MSDFKPPQHLFSKIKTLITDFIKDEIKSLFHDIFKKIFCGIIGAILILLKIPQPVTDGILSYLESNQKPNLTVNATIKRQIFYNGYSIEKDQYCRKITSSNFFWLPIYSDKEYDIFKEKFETTINVTDPGKINPTHAVIFLLRNGSPIIHFIIPIINESRSEQLVQFEYLSQDSNGNPIWLSQKSKVLMAPIDLSQDTNISVNIKEVSETDVQMEIDMQYYDSINGSRHFQTFTSETIPDVISLYSQNSFTFGLGPLKGQCMDIKKGF